VPAGQLVHPPLGACQQPRYLLAAEVDNRLDRRSAHPTTLPGRALPLRAAR
jgi:hypothetical protein